MILLLLLLRLEHRLVHHGTVRGCGLLLLVGKIPNRRISQHGLFLIVRKSSSMSGFSQELIIFRSTVLEELAKQENGKPRTDPTSDVKG